MNSDGKKLYVATWCDKDGNGRMGTMDTARGLVSLLETDTVTASDAMHIACGQSSGFARDKITYTELCALAAKERIASQCKACDGDGFMARIDGCDDPECCGPGRIVCDDCNGTGTHGTCFPCSGAGVFYTTSETSSVCNDCDGTGMAKS